MHLRGNVRVYLQRLVTDVTERHPTDLSSRELCLLEFCEYSSKSVCRNPNGSLAETLDNAEWYHGRLSRRNACELLQDNGDFLVRLARSKTDSLLKAVLSVRWNGRHYHFEIRERHGFFSVEEVRFDSIVSLIQHYLSKQCPITRRSAAVIKQAVPRVEYLDAPFILRGTVNVMVACLIIVFLYICSIM